MEHKRFYPNSTFVQLQQSTFENDVNEELSQFQMIRKKIKKDQHQQNFKQPQGELLFPAYADNQEELFQMNDLYQQQFQNLKACSFKTISKIGIQKINPFALKNDPVIQQQQNFPSTNKRRKQSLLISDQKYKNSQSKSQNKYPKNLLSYGSLNEISKIQKKYSVQQSNIDNFLDKLKKKQSLQSNKPSRQLNTFNTQFFNDIMDFNIKDDNQMDELELKKIVQKALIKNVKFYANILIVKKGSKQGCQPCELQIIQKSLYMNTLAYKILDVDGFSITGFYLQRQKIKINLSKQITNKQFQRKFVFKQSSSLEQINQLTLQQKGIKFKAYVYNNTKYQWQQVQMYISEIRQNSDNCMKNQQIENQNIDNVKENNNNMQKERYFQYKAF